MKKRFLLLALAFLFATMFSAGYMNYHQLNINDVALSVLSKIKKIQGNEVDLQAIKTADSPIVNHDIWTTLLQQHVSETGDVDYDAILADSDLFESYLQELSNHPPGANWSKNEKIAYWINAYNAFTVKLILDFYPLKSIKDISSGLPMLNSPWDLKFFKIAGVAFDLNTIEHEILRKDFNEPRIHFAINCASFSCPKLLNMAFTADSLETQLEAQTRAFLNNPDKNIITDKEIRVSKIFSWFQRDFGGQNGVLAFIQKYRPELNKENPVEYLDYNWGLNN
ncbi:MAG: DUF547 domain-containing protein [Calditrichia bacterium]